MRVDVFFGAQAIDTLGTVWRSAASGFINKIRHCYEFLSSKTNEKEFKNTIRKMIGNPKTSNTTLACLPMQGLDRLHAGVDLCDSSMSYRVLLDISALFAGSVLKFVFSCEAYSGAGHSVIWKCVEELATCVGCFVHVCPSCF